MSLSREILLRALVAVGSATVVGFDASGAVIFSNITVTGSLAAPGTYTVTTGPNDIDFAFLTASVGDTLPSRSGNIVITYLARTDDLSPLDSMLLTLEGGIAGRGTLIFNEVVEDLNDPGIIGSYGVTLGPSTPPPALPHTTLIPYTRGSNFVKVKKTVVLVAPDSQNPETLDLANISLIGQTHLPGPGSIALVGVAGIVALRRRRTG